MTVPLKTRILLADDHALVRAAACAWCSTPQPDLEVVAEAGDGAEAVELALVEEVDLAVLDVVDAAHDRPAGGARSSAARSPSCASLMLSMHDNEQYFFEALKAGASGYVLKSAADRDLVEACRATMRGEPFLYPAAVTALIRDYLDRAGRGEADAGRPAHAARARDRQADRRGPHQRRDRRDARDQQEDRRAPPQPTSSRSSACATASS